MITSLLLLRLKGREVSQNAIQLRASSQHDKKKRTYNEASRENVMYVSYQGWLFRAHVEIKISQRGVSDQSARNQVYDDTIQGFTKDTLRKKTQRAVKIFKLFRKIGVDKD